MIHPRVTADGQKNIVVTVSAILSGELPRTKILSFEDLTPTPKSIRFENIVYSFQKDLGLFFYWSNATEAKSELILPIEGRGYLNIEGNGGLMSPPGTTGIEIASYAFSPKATTFYFTLDLAKH